MALESGVMTKKMVAGQPAGRGRLSRAGRSRALMMTLTMVLAVMAALAPPARVARAASPAQAINPAATIPLGDWRLTLAFPGGELPVGLELAREKGAVVAYLVNGADRTRAEQTRIVGRTLTLAFPSYESSLSLTLAGDGRLAGTARLFRRAGPLTLKAVATHGDRWRFARAADPGATSVAGTWAVSLEEEGQREQGLATFRQIGSRVEGTFLFPSGDYRFLAGDVIGKTLMLSTFDGNQGTLWRGTLDRDGTLAGTKIEANSQAPARWTARRDASARLAAPARPRLLQPGFERLTFAFPDADGRMVSLADPRFRGKVVVVSIGGTWCPNCHDEARFLVPYHARHKARGLEVIGLQFEYTDDPARSAAQIRRFAQRYGITYPMLVAGVANPEATRKALPAIGGVSVYPTMLFIDRAGRLRRIHTGFSGPATGKLHTDFVKDFDGFVGKLLAEPTSR
jgi:peroxiredoxin